jgi:hypothetical protein
MLWVIAIAAALVAAAIYFTPRLMSLFSSIAPAPSAYNAPVAFAQNSGPKTALEG